MTSSAEVAKDQPHAPARRQIRVPWRRRTSVKGYALLSPTFMILCGLLLLPLLGAVVISFWTQIKFDFDTSFTLNNYGTILNYSEKPLILTLLGRSILWSLIATCSVILLAYPMAYFLAFKIKKNKITWLVIITIPFWTSYLLRVFSWKLILGFEGVINKTLINLGVITEPLEFILYSPVSVMIVLAHSWVVFAVLPIFVSLEKIDRSLLEAASDLGDTPVRRFFRVTLPLSLPGVISSSLMVFIPTVGDYVTPALVGGPEGTMLGSYIQQLFGKINNWPLGAAASVFMMGTVALVVCIYLGGIQLLRKRAEKL